jgi:uncharacterized protein YjeT (DUF2065 family)
LVAEALLTALALMLVLEGLLPFISPGGWRKTFERVLALSDGQLRFLGLCSICVGFLLLGVFGAW